jgi:hypothetical protein
MGQLIALDITGVSAIFAFAIAIHDDKVKLLLLLVPPLSSSLVLLWLDHMRYVTMIGTFIRTDLWPFLTKDTAQDSGNVVPNWEDRSASTHVVIAIELSFVIPIITIFSVSPLVALGMSFTSAHDPWQRMAWGGDALLGILAAAVGGWLWWTEIRGNYVHQRKEVLASGSTVSAPCTGPAELVDTVLRGRREILGVEDEREHRKQGR